MNENRYIVQNKIRLVIQDFNQIKWLNYNETYAPVDCLEFILTFLDFATFKWYFLLCQMDVKSNFKGVDRRKVLVGQI